jgi:DNA-binding NarL/FixJ family response regulator
MYFLQTKSAILHANFSIKNMKKWTIRLLLVDNSKIFREALAALISLEEDIEVVGEASSGEEAILLANSLNPDLILMDVRISKYNGVETTMEIRNRFPWIRTIVLATFNEDEYIYKSLQNGALNYILKGTPSKQIAAAIRSLDGRH